MKKLFFLLAAIPFLLVSCKDSFKKLEGGMSYKIISDGKSKALAYGDFFEVTFTQTYKGKSKDTLLGSSAEYGNQIAPLDSMQIPPVYFKIFKSARLGDSIIVKQLTDSLMKRPGVPKFFKKGDAIFNTYKIVKIFASKEEAEAAMKANAAVAKEAGYKKAIEKVKAEIVKSEAQMKTDDKIIQDYIAAKKLAVPVKTDWGTYVSMTAPGEGESITKDNVVLVKYTGKNLNDSVFDSNIDPKMGHTDALPVDMTEFNVIPGWIDALLHMKKGAKATVVIPSTLAYGPQGRMPKIAPNAVLTFDVEVVDVLNHEQFEAKQMADQQKQMEEQQKQMADEKMKQSSGQNNQAPSAHGATDHSKDHAQPNK